MIDGPYYAAAPPVGSPAPDVLRNEIARALLRAVSLAERPGARSRSREAILGCRTSIIAIAEFLGGSSATHPEGVRRAQTLTERLETMTSTDAISELVWWVADGLQLCPPHGWACPVISKLAPDRTTWTCRWCGALAVTPD